MEVNVISALTCRGFSKRMLQGVNYQYYGMSGNIWWLQNFYYQTVRLAFKWINRRNQRKSYNLDQFNHFIQFNPLLKLKIYHSLYNLKP